MKKNIALIVTYNPRHNLEYHLQQLFTEFEQVIVVDNGSPAEVQQILNEQASSRNGALHLLLNPYNSGVAAALNQGFRLAIQMGYEHVVTFDQDSLPVPGMAAAMLQVYNTHPSRDKLAVIAPVVEDPIAGIMAKYLRPKHRFFFERKHCDGQTLENVSIVITSGAMHNLKIYEQVGPFRDDFFIDYVDTEYCCRVRQHGFNIIVACGAHLQHKLGNQKKVSLGPVEMRPTFHSVTRWYYISRNRIPMLRLYGLHFPHWLLYELVINGYGFLRMLLFEDNKLGKILAALLGTLDGLTGRMGVISDPRKRLLSKFE